MNEQVQRSRPVIVVQMMNQYADLLSPLAAFLRERYGIGAILVHRGPTDLPDPARYHFDRAAFDALIDIGPALASRPKQSLPNSSALAAEIFAVEERLSLRLLDAVRADRHLGRGFVTGADYPRSRYGLSADFDQSLDIALRLARTFEALFKAHDVAAVVATPSSIYGNLMLGVAEGLRIPVRLPNLTTNTRFYWAADRYYRPQDFEAAFARARGRIAASADLRAAVELGPTARAAGVISSLPRHTTVGFLARAAYRAVRREAGHRLKRRGQVYGKYLLGDILRHLVAVWWLRRRARAAEPILPTLPAGLPYVFLPLSIEPESTLMAESPSCDNQLVLIDWLAKAMPSGWRLLVKEHPAFTAPRPRGFWERVRAYPNVLVVSPLERGEEVMCGAKAVATVRGTLGLQAAGLGIPIVTPHHAQIVSVLPHVFVTESYRAVEAALRCVAAGDLPPLAERLEAVAALAAAMDEVSTLIKDSNLIRGVAGAEQISPAEVEALASALAATLRRDAAVLSAEWTCAGR